MDNSQAPERIVNDHEETKLSAQQKPSKGGWRSAIFVIFVEVAERFSYYGVSGNLITYLTNVLGQPTATAAKNVNIWSGVSMVSPILGAIVADSYLGSASANAISISGFPAPPSINLLLALYIISIGEGGHKPCVQAFAADQFNDDMPQEKAAKSSFFNWWYSGIVSGASVSLLFVVYVQDSISWGTAYAILAAAVAAALGLFLMGIRHTGARSHSAARVFRWRRCWSHQCGRDEWMRRTVIAGFVLKIGGLEAMPMGEVGSKLWLGRLSSDKAMIVDNIDASSKTRNHWRLCPVNQVEEVKLLLRLVPIWLTSLMFTIVFAQLSTYFTKQGSTMIRSINGSRFQIPAASLQAINGITIVIFTVIYDRILVPVTRKITGRPSGITILQRMGIGHFISIFTMIIAGVMEAKRAISSRTGHQWLVDNLNRAHLYYFYWMLAGLSALNLCFFLWFAKGFEYKKIEWNDPNEEKISLNGYNNNGRR
ncbi:Protein NRT1/ PTR family 5.4 [Vitis vinifera]|uniref:Protein NRT1/ PTR family 5.4 n=1 Tax=Vitis vinifera TaxID=29760 RepID=A0A438CWF8_VITVI|nr:Protein NRT1/ PTR family 5.4 [Vitis vinifera]